MFKNFGFLILLGAISAVVLGPSKADADAFFSLEEFENNVIGTLSGSLDLTNADFSGTVEVINGNWIDSTELQFGDGSSQQQNNYIVSGPSTLTSGSLVLAGSNTANVTFALLTSISSSTFRISETADDLALTGQVIYFGQDFSSMGLSLGQSVYTFSNGETFTVQVQSVPEVSATGALAAFGSLLAVMAFLWERRRTVVV